MENEVTLHVVCSGHLEEGDKSVGEATYIENFQIIALNSRGHEINVTRFIETEDFERLYEKYFQELVGRL